MKLISLEMRNFRQHLDSKIDFCDGVTGIIGPNGAGKSTILEAVAWALYGAPALRGNNDSVRSSASEGGAKVSVSLVFELGGAIYRATRSLDSGGRQASATLEVDGRALRSGMTEVNGAIVKLLGMDYQAFFTSFFTSQKGLEFMASLEGRARAVAISRMLGYDRVTKARDQANEDRKQVASETTGIQNGLPDQEDLKKRKKEAEANLTQARADLDEVEKLQRTWLDAMEGLKPLKEASDQKAKLHDEINRRLEIDRADAARAESRLADIRAELADLQGKEKEFAEVRAKLASFKDMGEEYRKLAELSKHEGDRQRLRGQVAALETDIKRLQARERQLSGAVDDQMQANVLLSEAESVLADTDKKNQAAREEKVGRLNTLNAQIRQLESQVEEIQAKKGQIAEAGADGKCPTCERPLADELSTVLANFEAQSKDISGKIETLRDERLKCESDTSDQTLQENRQKIAAQIEELRARKSKADLLVGEFSSVRQDVAARSAQMQELETELGKLPAGFDEARFRELEELRESLRPVSERKAALGAELERVPKVQAEESELAVQSEKTVQEIARAEQTLEELAFSSEKHEVLVREFTAASEMLSAVLIELERRRGAVNTAAAILKQVEKEEESIKSRLIELERKRNDLRHLQAVAEGLDKLRADLNDRIRPELEGLASELLSTMTDGRYSDLVIDDGYVARIRDDGEIKAVISGGEDDIVNLALRLAISQMIADRAGQSFSLLVLDEVFGSLDDVRRGNVVALLQNLKNRFEQIILITHVESIHDAVDSCMWVAFDEKTKTCQLTDRLEALDQLAVD